MAKTTFSYTINNGDTQTIKRTCKVFVNAVNAIITKHLSMAKNNGEFQIRIWTDDLLEDYTARSEYGRIVFFPSSLERMAA